jgi:WD40 repeat protein
LASADLMGVVKRWDLTTGKSMGDLDGSVLHIYDKSFRADIGGTRSMTYSPDGRFLACGGITEVSNAFAGVGKPAVVLFDCATGKTKQLLVPKSNFQGTMWGVVFHPQGNLVVGLASGGGASLFFWSLDQAQSFHALALPVVARDLDIHPDGRRLALACFDGSTRIYDMGSKAKA